MEKIYVGLYGGKSIFEGKEVPLQGDTIYCECPDMCYGVTSGHRNFVFQLSI